MKTIQPKKDFLESPDGSAFAEIQNNRAFKAGVETALQQMTVEQISHTRFDDDARAHIELQGAKRFVDILLNLTVPTNSRKTEQPGVLQCQSKPQSPKPQPRPPKAPKPPKPPEFPRI